MEGKQVLDLKMMISPQRRIYHLQLSPEDIADSIIIVGDPNRVKTVSQHFDSIELHRENRELITHTGYYKGERISVISTGMGPDNIDIVLNELDALANIDFSTFMIKEKKKSLNIIRIGTSGALQKEIPADSFVASTYGMGVDGLIYFYKNADTIIERELSEEFIRQTNWPVTGCAVPYIVKGSEKLLGKIGNDFHKGITATSHGFYGPSGRQLRTEISFPDMIDRIQAFNSGEHKIVNFEMETSALYGLCKLLGHEALTVCLTLSNRVTGQCCSDYHKSMNILAKTILDRICC